MTSATTAEIPCPRSKEWGFFSAPIQQCIGVCSLRLLQLHMDFVISKPEFSAVATGKLTKVRDITSQTKEDAVTTVIATLWSSVQEEINGRQEWVDLPVPTNIKAHGQNAEILLELAKCKSATVSALGFNAAVTNTADGKIEVNPPFGFKATRQQLVVQQLHIRSFKPVEGEGEQTADEAIKDAAAQQELPIPTEDTATEAPAPKKRRATKAAA